MRSRYPPGPWPLPNLRTLYLLTKDPPRALTELVKRYGPVYIIGRGVKPIAVLCDKQGIEEAFTKRLEHLSSRSMNTMGSQIISLGQDDLYHASNTKRVELMRKITSSIVEMKKEEGFSVSEIVQQEMEYLMETVMVEEGNAIDPRVILNLPVINIIMMITLNFRFQSQCDHDYTKWTDLDLRQRGALYNAILVSFLPFLWNVWPGIRRSITAVSEEYNGFLSSHLEYHLSTYEMGITRDTMDMSIQYLLNEGAEQNSSENLTKSNIMGFAKSLLGAGTESIVGVIRWAFLLLLHRPSLQKRIQGELDNYVARSNISQNGKNTTQVSRGVVFNYSDRDGLPYLNAFIHEVMRKWPVTPLSMPRKVLVDTSIGRYNIPKDTFILFNIHACHMDGEIWENPRDFNPERFLNVSGQFDSSKAKQLMLFGIGDRSCVGERLVMMEVFSCLANIMHSFSLECASIDKLPSMEDVDYRLQYLPKEFKIIFKMR